MTGSYVFQWYWEFNAGSPYSTCFDVDVVAEGSGNGSGGTSGTPSEASGAFGGSLKGVVLGMGYATFPTTIPISYWPRFVYQ